MNEMVACAQPPDTVEDRVSDEHKAAWAFVAHKDGYWAGVAAASLPRRELSKFLGEFGSEGFTITTVHDRSEYDAVMANLKAWPTKRVP